MKLILSNDDGIDAEGLDALYQAAKDLGDVTVMAPQQEESGVSHRVTTRDPIHVEERRPNWYAIGGTPSDCARIAMHYFPEEPFWLLAGINHGGNLGVDVWHSGTVAVVREAVIHGRPGIAFSQYRRRGIPTDWKRSSRWIMPIIQDLVERTPQIGTFWSVNLPDLPEDAPDPEIVECPIGPSPLPLGFRVEEDLFFYHGNYHERAREPGKDVDVCFSGKIAVSQIRLT